MIKPAVQVFGGRRLKGDEGEGGVGTTQSSCRGFGTCAEVPIQVGVIARRVCSCVQNENGMQSTAFSWHGAALGFFLGESGWRGGWGVLTQHPASAARCSTMHKYKYAHLTSAQCTNKTLACRFCWSGTKGGGAGGAEGRGGKKIPSSNENGIRRTLFWVYNHSDMSPKFAN